MNTPDQIRVNALRDTFLQPGDANHEFAAQCIGLRAVYAALGSANPLDTVNQKLGAPWWCGQRLKAQKQIQKETKK